MNSYEINYLGSKMIRGLLEFGGVYAADTFISAIDILSTKSQVAYVVNIELAHFSGLHWVAILLIKGKFKFFDPLGLGPWHYCNLDIFSTVCYNSYPLQNPFSNTSAHICLLLLHLFSHGLSFYHIIHWFNNLFYKYTSINNGVLVIITACKLLYHVSARTDKENYKNLQSSVIQFLFYINSGCFIKHYLIKT